MILLIRFSEAIYIHINNKNIPNRSYLYICAYTAIYIYGYKIIKEKIYELKSWVQEKVTRRIFRNERKG